MHHPGRIEGAEKDERGRRTGEERENTKIGKLIGVGAGLGWAGAGAGVGSHEMDGSRWWCGR